MTEQPTQDPVEAAIRQLVAARLASRLQGGGTEDVAAAAAEAASLPAQVDTFRPRLSILHSPGEFYTILASLRRV